MADKEGSGDTYRILSHQLRSPINTIQSLLKTIADGFTGEISPQALSLIERAIGRAGEASELISDLLDYEMLSQRREAPQKELDLVVLLNALVTRLASQASDKEISLVSTLPLERRIILLGDRRGLEQAVGNLIENAIQYTPAGGQVRVSLIISEAESLCRLQVADTGVGIQPSEQEKIFDPFYRSIKVKSSISGTGLGLPIARRVIEGHGGRISVESKENRGATFQIELPYARIEAGERKPARRKKVVIIGGVTAGPKTAARLRRLDEEMDITIVERSQFLSYSGCGLPSYISGRVRTPKALMSTADHNIRDVHFFETIKDITALNNSLATEINCHDRKVRVRDLSTGVESELGYDYLVLATGGQPLIPDIPGIGQEGIYSLYSLEEAERIKERISDRVVQDVCIIGGGLIGISTAESLVATGTRLTILEKRSTILQNLMDPDIARKIQHELSRKGIKIVTDSDIREIRRSDNQFLVITGSTSYPADLIILSTGVKPNVALAKKAGLEIGESGGIKVNEYLQTSEERIYAIGDCAESKNLITGKLEYWPLGSISTKMGRIAADNIAGGKSEFKGSNGTALMKIVDVNVARTGLTSEAARRAGFEIESTVVSGLDKTHYRPEAGYVVLKLVAERKTKRLLGAQGYGRGEVVPRIQLLSAAISQALSLEEVFKLDLGYSPAFNNPIDILQTACLVLNNKIDGLFAAISLEEFERVRNRVQVVSVCPQAEYAINSIPGSINIPLENLRLEDLPYDKETPIVLYSKTSSGAYKAYKYLASQGYTDLRVLEGGFIYWGA